MTAPEPVVRVKLQGWEVALTLDELGFDDGHNPTREQIEAAAESYARFRAPDPEIEVEPGHR